MRKLQSLILMLFAFSALTMAQVVENFESQKMNLFSGGSTGTVGVVTNPDASGINTSAYVGKMHRAKDGDRWQGWYGPVSGDSVDAVANRYAHIKVWKSRISPTCFKLENGTAANSGDVFSTFTDTVVNQWFEVVFDFGTHAGKFKQIVLIPDFPADAVGLDADIDIYFDDIYMNNDPAVGSAPVQVLEDFEPIPLNVMTGGADDLSKMTVVANPHPGGVNLSTSVVEFLRDKDGVIWGGFWSALPKAVDVTDNKFVHVKVWKSRISPVKFKLEGGAAGTLEIESMYPQTKVDEWEDIVFDFRSKTGTYPIIAFMPDAADPVGLSEDATIYFDDIIVSNDSVPAKVHYQTFNIDMTAAFVTTGPKNVWIAGSFGGKYGSWSEPSKNAECKMTDPDGDGIYSLTMQLENGSYMMKIFQGDNWNSGFPASDMAMPVNGDLDTTFKWYGKSLNDVNLIVDGHFTTDGTITPTSTLSPAWGGWTGNNGTANVVDGVCVMTPGAASDQWQLQVNQVGNDNGWRVDNDSTFVLMFDAWAAADRVFAIDFEDNSGNGYKRFGLSSDPDAVNGESEWQVMVTTSPVTYLRVVKFNAVKDNTTFRMNIMPSAKTDIVYIDNIYLINMTDFKAFGSAVSKVVVKGDGGATTIETKGGTLQMLATLSPTTPLIKNVEWSVADGTGSATIDRAGLLTAVADGTVTVTCTSKDWKGVSGTLEVTISNQGTGVANTLANSVRMYPNPVVSELNMSLPVANAKVAIYNSLGRKMIETTVQGTVAKFDVNSYARGVYFVQVNNETVGKFVK